MRRMLWIATIGALLALGGCGGGGGSPQASCTPAGTQLSITAKNIAFDTSCLATPARQAFTIRFANEDSGTPHNLQILTTSGRSLFKGAIVTGVKTVTYSVKGLPPGHYTFHCDVHPSTMNGTFIVG